MLLLPAWHSYSATCTPPPTISDISVSVMSTSIAPSSHGLRLEFRPVPLPPSQPPSQTPSETDSNERLGGANGSCNDSPVYCLHVPCHRPNSQRLRYEDDFWELLVCKSLFFTVSHACFCVIYCRMSPVIGNQFAEVCLEFSYRVP